MGLDHGVQFRYSAIQALWVDKMYILQKYQINCDYILTNTNTKRSVHGDQDAIQNGVGPLQLWEGVHGSTESG